MSRRLIALLGTLALLVAACGAEPGDGSSTTLDGTWQLESGTIDGEPIPLVEGYRITFNAAGSEIGGTAACNQYGGSFAVAAGELTLDELSFTEMACEPMVMESEAAYLLAIQRINRAAHQGDRLILTGPGTEMQFAAVPPVPDEALVGTTWVLDGLIASEAITSVRGAPLELVFTADGRFTAGTGCRMISGTYTVTGDEVQTPDLAAEGDCPVDLQEQDGHVVSVLEGFTVAIEGGRLTLTARGNEGLVYRAEKGS